MALVMVKKFYGRSLKLNFLKQETHCITHGEMDLNFRKGILYSTTKILNGYRQGPNKQTFSFY